MRGRLGGHTAPKPDELEVSVFGSGIGECIVIHLGNEQWMIVDSCLDKNTREPVALRYLRELNVDVATCVPLVVVTHWHDDHIRGSARVFANAKRARFVCSAALDHEDFYRFIVGSRESTPTSSYESEFLSIFREIEGRAPRWDKEGKPRTGMGRREPMYLSWPDG